jgi:UDP-3-O-[3-hydroxymyristoyl] glucosamine N-acyltransferase
MISQAMDGGIVKVPQIGIVVVEDDVEIGANAAIDRAKTGATRIGRGTKIDNLVHIAHNVKTGQSCVIVAQVGIAGSVRLGNGVTIAGQAGVKDQVSIGDGAVVAARAGVAGDLAAGGQYSGFPARPGKEFLRSQVGLSRLPELQKTVRQLQEEIEELKKRLDQLGGE